MALPICVADYQGSATPLLHLFGREGAPEDWLDGEDVKELRTHSGDSRILRRGARHHSSLSRGEEGHRLERGTLIMPILDVRDRDLF